MYADSTHPAYHVIKNVVPSQMYVAELRLEDYPVTVADLLHTGEDAFSAALNTVNIGKFNLCFGGIGLTTHSLYEAITHAHHRVLYGKPVTDMPHIRRMFRRLLRPPERHAALLRPSRRLVPVRQPGGPPLPPVQSDHQDEGDHGGREGHGPPRRDVAAKGFEADNFLPIAKVDVAGLPKLEGTVAVN